MTVTARPTPSPIIQTGLSAGLDRQWMITGTVDGHSIAAKTAISSVDPSVILFWFDTTEITVDSNLTIVSAYDVTGKQLGHTKINREGG